MIAFKGKACRVNRKKIRKKMKRTIFKGNFRIQAQGCPNIY
jgi:hypothetical protein